MKNTRYALAACLLTALVVPVDAAAADSGRSAPLNVYVQAENAGNVYAVKLDIAFDARLLEFVEAEPALFTGEREELKQGNSLWNDGQRNTGLQAWHEEAGELAYLATQLGQGDVRSGSQVSLVKLTFNRLGSTGGISDVTVSDGEAVTLENGVFATVALDGIMLADSPFQAEGEGNK
ncbi:MAG: hypothetical protein K0R57_5435 [Paenibacillaceae bacterium]|nr:hypothetical protein [Paenibacillaceae bacterium]